MTVNSSLHTVKALSHSVSLCQALDLIQIDHHIWDIHRTYLLLSVILHWVLYSLDHEALQLPFLQRTHTCSHTYTHTHFKSNWIYHYKKMVMRMASWPQDWTGLLIPQKGTPGSAAFSPGSAPSGCDRGGTASHFETFLPAAALWSTNTCMLPSHLVLSGHPIAIEFLEIFAGGLGKFHLELHLLFQLEELLVRRIF